MKNLIVILLFISSVASAQKIDWNNFDQNKYNEILMEEISKVRVNSLAPKYDATLMKAAEYHGYYVAVNNLVTHVDTSASVSRLHSDRIRMFIPNADIVEYYTQCVLDSTITFHHNYNCEIVCSFPLSNKDITYRDLAKSALDVYKTSPGHWDAVQYKSNRYKTSAHERAAGFIGFVDGKVYSVILFYDDEYYDKNDACFHLLSHHMLQGLHDLSYEHVAHNNLKSETTSTVKVIEIAGEKLKVNVSVNYIDHIDNGLQSSKVAEDIKKELANRKSKYIKKAGL